MSGQSVPWQGRASFSRSLTLALAMLVCLLLATTLVALSAGDGPNNPNLEPLPTDTPPGGAPIGPTPTLTSVRSSPTATPTQDIAAASPTPLPPTATPLPPTPTIEPTASPSPGSEMLLQATLGVDPQEALPGESVTYTLVLTSMGQSVLSGLQVSSTLPSGLDFVTTQPGTSYDPASRRWQWDVTSLATDTGMVASFQTKVNASAPEIVDNRVEVTGPKLIQPIQAEARLAVASEAVIRGSGGELVSSGGRVRVEFPAGAVERPVRVRYVAQPQRSNRFRFHVFELAAWDETSRAPATRFNVPLRLTVRYTPEDVAGLPEDRLHLETFDATTGQWRELPSQVDVTNHQVTAQVDHFSLFSVVSVPEVIVPPTLLDFQTDLLAGGASFEYSLEVPPGPAGFGPQLVLRYSSALVNEMTSEVSNASWVGTGWSLDLGRITRYKDYDGTPKYQLTLNETSYELVQGSGNRFYTKRESFLYVEKDPPGQPTNSWRVRTKDGAQYFFGRKEAGSSQLNGGGPGSRLSYREDAGGKTTAGWLLDGITDTHGNQVIFYHQNWGQPISDTAYVRESYPKFISYTLGAGETQVDYRIEFQMDADGSKWRPCEASQAKVYETQRLKEIRVIHAPSNTLIRKYVLTWYDGEGSACSQTQTDLTGEDPNPHIYPDALASVTEYGQGGIDPLPTLSFGYENHFVRWRTTVHTLRVPYRPYLITATNGYGGQVEYQYTEWDPHYDDDPDDEGFSRWLPISQMVSGGMTGSPSVDTTCQFEDGTNHVLRGGTGCVDNRNCTEQFIGFQNVTVTVPSANSTWHTYHATQGNRDDPQNGTETGILVRDSTLTELRRTENTYEVRTIRDGVSFVPLTQTDALIYDGQPTPLQRRTRFDYDNYGNQNHVYQDGDLALATDDRHISRTFTVSDTLWIVDKVAREETLDAQGTVHARTDYFYNRDAGGNLTGGMSATGDLLGTRQYSVIGGAYAETQYWYDDWGNQVRGRDPNQVGQPAPLDTRIRYDDQTHTYPISTTNPLGHQTLTEYYAINETNPGQGAGLPGQVKQVTGPNGDVTAYQYDAFGRLTHVWQPGEPAFDTNKATQVYSYTEGTTGVPSQVFSRQRDDAGGNGTASYRDSDQLYNGLGRLIQSQAESAASGQIIVSDVGYDARGLKAWETAPYTVSGSLGSWPGYETGKPRTDYGYDPLGRTTVITGPDEVATRTDYRQWDTAVVDGNDHQQIQTQDAFGRLVQVREYTGTYPGGVNWEATPYATTRYGYDVLDHLVVVTDTLNHTTTLTYDALGRKTGMTDPDMGTWSYGYDAAGNLVRQTDARNQRVCFYYDALNRLTGKTYSTGSGDCPGDPGYISYTVKYGYDNFLYDANEAHSWGRRRWMRVGAANVNEQSFRYDLRGQVVTETVWLDNHAYATEYSYDADDQLQTLRYPADYPSPYEVITTTYTAQGLPDSLKGTLAGQFTNYPYVSASTYNAAGQIKRLDLGNGLAERFGYFGYKAYGLGSDLDLNAYDSWGGRFFGRLMQHCVGPASASCPLISSGPEVMNWSYWYDNVGNVKNIRDAINANQLLTFEYDPLDRLVAAGTTATGAGAYVTRTYEYDPIGNLTNFEGASNGYQGGKPHAVTHVNGVQKYWYDEVGNMTSRDGATLTWDAENRLSSINQDGRRTTFTYDADGRRVKKETPWGTTYYVGEHYERYVPAAGLSVLPGDVNADCWVSAVDVQLTAVKWGLKWGDAGYDKKYDIDQDGVVTAGDLQATAANWRATAPSPCTGPAVTEYYWLGERLVALRQNGVLRYIHTDHLSSISLLTDGSGQVVPGSVQRFMPFGKVRTGQPAILPASRNFTGQPLDLNTGLLYYGSSQGYGRYYDPALGRWTQPDTIVPNPSNPQDLNRYSYGRSNPLRYTDPSGHCIPGVNCPGDISGVEPPPEAPPGGEAYAAWLVHLILWEEQQQAETGGMLNTGLTQQAAAFELSTFLMKDPELAQEIVYQQVMMAAPQIAAQAAGASTDILISGAGWALGMVRQAASQRIGGAEQNLVGIKVYRVWGTDPNNPDLTKQSGPWGESWTPIDPSTVPNYREATGLPSGGKSGAFNAGRFVSVGIINDASGIQVRQALSVDGKPGGLLEFMVPNSEAQITLIGVYGVNPPY